jgi:hypothetical protein
VGGYDLPLAPFGGGERIGVLAVLCPNERASNASIWHIYLVQAEDGDMRDFRDAKGMTRTIRAALDAKGLKITNSEGLELIAEAFGVADWNTLSAMIRKGPPGSASPSPTVEGVPVLPFSVEFAATMRRALAYANQRNHEYATLEHLSLALADDPDASRVVTACKRRSCCPEKKVG